ncbi:MAG: hypothetical protein ACREOZ_01295, partial [Gloeomargaritales cyanobacterium]
MVTLTAPSSNNQGATPEGNAAAQASTASPSVVSPGGRMYSRSSGSAATSIVLTPALLRMPVLPSPSPYTQRPVDPKMASKYYELAIKGLKIKYDGEDKAEYTIPVFAKSVERHLQLHGLLDDFYFVDQADGNLKSILHHYDCFTLEDIVVGTNKVTDIDKVDNMDRAGKFLSDSLSNLQLGKQMKYHQYPTHGPVVWMLHIKENWSGSESALKSLALKLE